MTNPHVALHDLIDCGDRMQVQVYTDAKSLFDVVSKDTSRPTDKRLRVVVAQLREMISSPGMSLAWIDNSMMLADSLTKVGAERRYLLDAIEANVWSEVVTEEALAIKQKLRDGRHAIAEVARNLKKEKLSKAKE